MDCVAEIESVGSQCERDLRSQMTSPIGSEMSSPATIRGQGHKSMRKPYWKRVSSPVASDPNCNCWTSSKTYRNMPTRSPLQQLDINTTPFSSISRRQRDQGNELKESADFATPLLSRQASPSCSHTSTSNVSGYSSPAEFKQWISSVFPTSSGDQEYSSLQGFTSHRARPCKEDGHFQLFQGTKQWEKLWEVWRLAKESTRLRQLIETLKDEELDLAFAEAEDQRQKARCYEELLREMDDKKKEIAHLKEELRLSHQSLSQVRRESHDAIESVRSDHLKGQDDQRHKTRIYEKTIQDLQKQVSDSREREQGFGKSVATLMSLFQRSTPFFKSVEAAFEKIEERVAGFDSRIETMSSDVLVLKSASRERRVAASSKEMAIQNLTRNINLSHNEKIAAVAELEEKDEMISLLVRQLKDSNENCLDQSKQVVSLQNKIQSMDKAHRDQARAKDESEALRLENAEMEKKVDQLTTDVHRLEECLDQCNKRLSLSKQERDCSIVERKNLNSNVEFLRSEVERLGNSLVDHDVLATQSSVKVEKAQGRIADLESQLAVMTGSLQKKEAQRVALQDQVEQIKQENEALSCEMESNRQKVKSLEEELTTERESIEGERKNMSDKGKQSKRMPDAKLLESSKIEDLQRIVIAKEKSLLQAISSLSRGQEKLKAELLEAKRGRISFQSQSSLNSHHPSEMETPHGSDQRASTTKICSTRISTPSAVAVTKVQSHEQSETSNSNSPVHKSKMLPQQRPGLSFDRVDSKEEDSGCVSALQHVVASDGTGEADMALESQDGVDSANLQSAALERSFNHSDKSVETPESISSCSLLSSSQHVIKTNQWEDRQILLQTTKVESMALQLLLGFKNDLAEAKNEIGKLVHDNKELEGELIRERAGREQSDEALMSCTRDAVKRIKELQNHIKEYRDQVAELQIELERERERSDVQIQREELMTVPKKKSPVDKINNSHFGRQCYQNKQRKVSDTSSQFDFCIWHDSKLFRMGMQLANIKNFGKGYRLSSRKL